MRSLLGEVAKVSAIGDAVKHRTLTVTMTSADGVLGRWSEMPLQTGDARLCLLGPRGAAELTMADADALWRLTIDGQTRVIEGVDDPAAAVAAFAAAVREPAAGESWSASCRVLEIVDAAQRGLARGRTIELYNEAPTEESTFKGMMAAGGCLLLLLVLLALLVGSVVEGIRLPYLRAQQQAELDQAPAAHAEGVAHLALEVGVLGRGGRSLHGRCLLHQPLA